MIDQSLLEILVCPVSKQKLRMEDTGLVRMLNQMIASGQLKNVSGQVLTQQLDGLLVREDGQIAYGIIDGIPNMIAQEGIALPQK